MAELIYEKRNRYRVVFILKVNYQQHWVVEYDLQDHFWRYYLNLFESCCISLDPDQNLANDV